MDGAKKARRRRQTTGARDPFPRHLGRRSLHASMREGAGLPKGGIRASALLLAPALYVPCRHVPSKVKSQQRLAYGPVVSDGRNRRVSDPDGGHAGEASPAAIGWASRWAAFDRPVHAPSRGSPRRPRHPTSPRVVPRRPISNHARAIAPLPRRPAGGRVQRNACSSPPPALGLLLGPPSGERGVRGCAPCLAVPRASGAGRWRLRSVLTAGARRARVAAAAASESGHRPYASCRRPSTESREERTRERRSVWRAAPGGERCGGGRRAPGCGRGGGGRAGPLGLTRDFPPTNRPRREGCCKRAGGLPNRGGKCQPARAGG